MTAVLTFGTARPRPAGKPRRWGPWAAAVAGLFVVGALALATAGDDDTGTQPPPPTSGDAAYRPLPGVPLTGPEQNATPGVTMAPQPDAADPYAIFQTLKPADAPDLSPDDALARAILGCGTEWPPGTTDAALQQAYVGSGRIRCPS